MAQFEETWRQLQGSLGDQNITILSLGGYLILGGILALYVRLLYRNFSSSPSDTDSITRVFPLLTLVTTCVIAVVKSSLALSLGLVGALSIVRFRAAIKEPEELAYLFLCIAIGLALGAEQPLLAITLVVIGSIFVVGMYLGGGSKRQDKLILKITGDSAQAFTNDKDGVLSTVQEVAGQFTLQRFDVENGRSQVRIVLAESNPRKTATVIMQLHERLPDCEMSYVNLNSTL